MSRILMVTRLNTCSPTCRPIICNVVIHASISCQSSIQFESFFNNVINVCGPVTELFPLFNVSDTLLQQWFVLFSDADGSPNLVCRPAGAASEALQQHHLCVSYTRATVEIRKMSKSPSFGGGGPV